MDYAARLARSYEVGAGVRNLPRMHTLAQPHLIVVDGVQDPSIGRVGLGLAFDPNVVHRAGQLTTPEGDNQIVLSSDSLRSDHGVSFTYRVAAAWSGGGWTNPVQHVAEVLLQEEAQPVVTLLQHESTAHPERLTSEPQ